MLETLTDEIEGVELNPKQIELVTQEKSFFHRLKTLSTMDETEIISLSSEVTQFYTGPYAREQFWLTGNEEYQKYRDTIVTLLFDILITQLETLSSIEAKAYLLESLFYLTDLSPEIQGKPVKNYIEKTVKEKNADLLNALLHRSLSIGITVHTAIEHEKRGSLADLSEKEKIDMLPTLIDGISFFSIEWAKSSGFESMQFGNETTMWALDSLRADPKLLQENPDAQKIINEVAENYAHFFIETQDELSSGYPSHNTSRTIVEILTKLYSNRGENIPEINPGFIDFLKKLYAQKVLKFSFGTSYNYLHGWFMGLLETIGYDAEKFMLEAGTILETKKGT